MSALCKIHQIPSQSHQCISFRTQWIVCEDSGVYLNIVVLILTFLATLFRKNSAFSVENAKDVKIYLNFQNSACIFLFVSIKKPKVLWRHAPIIGLMDINFQNNNSVSNNRMWSFTIRFRKWPVIPCNENCDLLLTLEKSQHHPQIMTQLYSKPERWVCPEVQV